MKTLYLIPLIAALTIGCEKNGTKTDDGLVRFEVSYPGTKATDSAFENGDRVGLYMTSYDGEKPQPLRVSGNYANNACLTLGSGGWSSSPALYWNPDEKYDVYAYYPIAYPLSVDEMDMTIATDQSTLRNGENLGGYEASDFLWAKTAAVSYPGPVPLKFKHIMSRVLVNIVKGPEFEGEVPEGTIVRVLSTTTDAIVDIDNGIVIKNPYSAPQTITAKRLSETQFAAIIVPQKITTRHPVFEILSKGVSYLVEMRMDFKQGISHTMNITLNSDPEKVRIEIGGEIENWTE